MEKIVGIDPDIIKSGVAIWLPETQKFEKITDMSFFELLGFFKDNASNISVVVEAGWLDKGNRHITDKTKPRIAAKAGEHLGRNFQIGIDIVDAAMFFNIPCRIQKPLRPNIWKNSEVMFKKITGVKGGNPEKRDAAMLVFKLK